MFALLLLTIGVPLLLLLIAALFARVSQKRSAVALARGLRIALISGAAIALLLFVFRPRAPWLVELLTQQGWTSSLSLPDSPFQFALPLVVDAVAVAVALSARRVASQLIGLKPIAALLFHLAQILQMVNAVGSVSGSFSAPTPGGATRYQIWIPLAALSPGLLFSSLAASTAAIFVWASVFWRAAFACSSASATPNESLAR